MSLSNAATTLARALRVVLEAAVATLIGSLTLLVVVGVAFRKAGAALVFYDELASILLAWLTFYGTALAGLHGAHIGFPALVQRAGPRLRPVLIAARRTAVVAFGALVAWGGWRVMDVLEGTRLVSLPSVPAALAHSAVPIGATLYALAELLASRAPADPDEP